MLNQKHYEFSVTANSLVFGSKNSPITITVFLSLNCSPCAKAFEKIKEIFQSEMKVSINIVLITDDIKILNALYLFARQNKNEEAIELLNKWYNAHPYSRNKLSENLCTPVIEDFPKKVINENYKLFEECNLTHTPTFFINGYQLPNQYDIEDIVYFKELFK
jgi:protein-disulfide isomerase